MQSLLPEKCLSHGVEAEAVKISHAKVNSDSRTDFLPCFMACEVNVPRYALGVPLYCGRRLLRSRRSVRESNF